MVHNFWKKMQTSEPCVTAPPCHPAPSRGVLAPGLPHWECCRPPLPCQGPLGISVTPRQVCLLDRDPSPSPWVSLRHMAHCDHTWWGIFFTSAWPTGWPPPRTGTRPFLSLSHIRAWHRRDTPAPGRRQDKLLWSRRCGFHGGRAGTTLTCHVSEKS